ncbi:MAG: (Fe-S)-binding protein [Candidatus Micrarchaeota archaeon]
MGFLDKFMGGNTLYYPGCLTKFALRDVMENYEKIFGKLRIDFIKLKELEACCGLPVITAGYEEDARTLAEKNYKLFKERGVARIVCNCPACYRMFTHEYPKLIKWDIPAEHAMQTIWSAMKKGAKFHPLNLKVTYHDPCKLRMEGVFDEPREILRALGCEIKEMRLARSKSFCCGGGGGMRANFPALTKAVAKERAKHALDTRADVLVTPCPMCYVVLKEALEGEMEVKELSMLLV